MRREQVEDASREIAMLEREKETVEEQVNALLWKIQKATGLKPERILPNVMSEYRARDKEP